MSVTQVSTEKIYKPAKEFGISEGSINDNQAKSELSHTPDLYAPPNTRIYTWIFSLFIVAAIYVGWNVREYEIMVAESGLGYALGIIGGLFMLMLLLYPLRKKIRLMRQLGTTRFWFKAHMILGILGPVLILFHANFSTGSMNSNVALVSMLLVAVSGIIGRYVYTKIHYGLYGKRESLKDLRSALEKSKRGLFVVFGYAPKLRHHLQSFDAAVTTSSPNILYSVISIFLIGLRIWWNYIVMLVGLRRALKVTALRSGWTDNVLKKHKKDAHRYVAAYLLLVKKIVLFSFYERLFAKWHIFHLPLFIMLVMTGLVHVVSVHMY